MSAHILRFSQSEHREAERLLPWLVNGTLEEDERVAVLRHVEICTQCRDALAEVHALREAWLVPGQDIATDPRPSFNRLHRRLRVTPVPPSSSSWWASLRGSWATVPAWLRGAAAVQLALLLALVGMRVMPEPPAPAAYRTLGDTARVPPSAPADARLVVVFEPDISQARTQQLLRASDARIVNGPSDAGAYVLAVPATRVRAVRDGLRAAAGVTLVEDLDPAVRQ